MSWLDKRVLVVTGKGGVGKTTVAAALALRAARRGRRVVLAETQGAQRVPGLFGAASRGYRLTRLEGSLYTISLDSDSAIEDYVIQQIKVRALYKMVFQNRVMAPFLRALPGLHDLVQLGKIWDLERQRRDRRFDWDLLVVDAPATGHGLSMLNAPQSMMDLTVAGPFHDNAKLIRDLFHDRTRTGLVLVALPEEVPVNETLDLYSRLGAYREQVDLCVLNEVRPAPMHDLDAWDRARPHLAAAADEAMAEALAFTDRAVHRARRLRAARARLSDGLPCPLVELPFLFDRDLGADQLAALGDAVGAS